jgi:FkbM family methyltransferase
MARIVTPAGRVYAFEPMPAIHMELMRNVQLNQFEHVECVRKAVSDRTGVGRFVRGHHEAAGHLTSGGRGDPMSDQLDVSFDVEETTLDDFVRQGGRPPTFIKVDVEGSEGAVLHGARSILGKHRPVLLIELHTPEQDVAVGRILQELDYIARRVERGTPPLEKLTTGWPDPRGIWGQILAVPAEPTKPARRIDATLA